MFWEFFPYFWLIVITAIAACFLVVVRIFRLFSTGDETIRHNFYLRFWVSFVGAFTGFSLALIGNFVWNERLEDKNIEKLLINVYNETKINREVISEYLGDETTINKKIRIVASIEYTRQISSDQLKKLLNISPKHSESLINLRAEYIRKMIDITSSCKDSFEKFKKELKKLLAKTDSNKSDLSEIQNVKLKIRLLEFQFQELLNLIEEDITTYLGVEKFKEIKYRKTND